MFSSLLLAAHEEVKNEASERYAVYLHRCEVAAARGPHVTRNAVVLVDENTAPECAHLSRAGEEELKADVDDDDDFLCSLRRDELAELKLEEKDEAMVREFLRLEEEEEAARQLEQQQRDRELALSLQRREVAPLLEQAQRFKTMWSAPKIDVQNEGSGVVVSTKLPCVGKVSASVKHEDRTISITVQPDADALKAFRDAIPSDLLDLSSDVGLHLSVLGKKSTTDCDVDPSYDESTETLRVFISNTRIRSSKTVTKPRKNVVEKLRSLLSRKPLAPSASATTTVVTSTTNPALSL